MHSEPTLLVARWVAPIDRPPIHYGAVGIINGRILAVGPAAEVRRRIPGAAERDLGDRVILPGLVNAHVHLELSDTTPGDPPSSFDAWLLRVISRGAQSAEQIRADVTRAVAIGVEQCRRFGVTSVGDVSRQCRLTRPLLKTGQALRVVSFGEVQGMGTRRVFFDERFAAATETVDESDRLRIGVSPHAPYSLEPSGYRKCLEYARATGRRIVTHLAESPHESEFLAHGTGPFRRLWDAIGGWDDAIPRFVGGPIRFAKSLGLLDHPTLLAHVNYCDDAELDLLAAGATSVVYCPRTHRFFGHPPHRWRDMLARGINVCLGTDSCASSPDLNLLDDLRLVRSLAPDVRAEELFKLVTINGANALGMESDVGSLTIGKRADWIAFECTSDSPLDEVLDRRSENKLRSAKDTEKPRTPRKRRVN